MIGCFFRRSGRWKVPGWFAWAVAAALWPVSAAQAQQTFFMVLKGRVTASSTVSPRDGDQFIARMNGQSFTTTLNGAGEFQGLSISKVGSDPAPITFQMRQRGATYTVVGGVGSTTELSLPFNGYNNPLSAAFNAQTVNSFVGPRVGGGGTDPPTGGGTQGDPRDVDRNGMIELIDAQLVMEFVVGFRDSTLIPARFDANSDGRINTDDVVAILRNVGEEAEQPATSGNQNTNPLTQAQGQ